MISYWVPSTRVFGIQDWAQTRAPAVLPHLDVRTYESLSPRMALHGGAHVFSAVDELSPAGKQAIASIWDQLASHPTSRLLNDPRKVLGRYDLLTRLADEGVNTYRIHRADTVSSSVRFPVFIRHAVHHSGDLSGLIRSWGALRTQLWRWRLKGTPLRDLLVVEWLDARDQAGRFRKYAAFRIGDEIIPAHVMTSSAWMVKAGTNELHRRTVDEELAYVRENPHRGWVDRVFRIAGIEYGRLDYGLADGRLQAWEINVNPTVDARIGPRPQIPPELDALREPSRVVRHAGLTRAFLALDVEPSPPVDVTLDPRLLSELEQEAARAAARKARVQAAESLFLHPWAAPLRGVWRRFFRR